MFTKIGAPRAQDENKQDDLKLFSHKITTQSKKVYKFYRGSYFEGVKTETIKDLNFNPIGYVQTDDKGNKTVRDASFNTKGFYSKSSNVTQDQSFKNVAWGDQTRILLR